jgi:PEP-CTERM motif
MREQFSVRRIVAAAFALVMCAGSNTVLAQGVAGGPFTIHNVQPGPAVVIGSAASPVPIDLEPLDPPWSKSIDDPSLLAVGPTILDMTETIINSGTEPWGDWHEIILAPPSGLPPSTWLSVIGLTVNGNPIGFNATGLGTQVLTLDTFSQPVLPGDVFGIHKTIDTNGSQGLSGAFLRIQEYPTPAVPEPASLALAAVGGLVLMRMKRRR